MSLDSLKMRENNTQLHNSVSQKHFASGVNIIFMSQMGKLLYRKVIFPRVNQYCWEYKVCSQPIDLFAQQLCFPFPSLSLQSINITCQRTGASEEAQTGMTCSDQAFTAFNSECLRCSRRFKGKTKNIMVMLTLFSWCWGRQIQKRTGVY